MPYFSMQSGRCSLPDAFGRCPCPKRLISEIPVNGVGNGITEPKHGYHTGRICQMQATVVQCYLIVSAWCHARATASVIEPEFATAHYATVKQAAHTTLGTHD